MLLKHRIAQLVSQGVEEAQRRGVLPPGPVPEVEVERPQHSEHGDFSTSLPLRLARAARRNGLGDLAVHTMREAARTHPRRHEPLAELVLIFLDQGDAAKAREAFRNLEGLDPQHPSVAVARRRLERARSSRD